MDVRNDVYNVTTFPQMILWRLLGLTVEKEDSYSKVHTKHLHLLDISHVISFVWDIVHVFGFFYV